MGDGISHYDSSCERLSTGRKYAGNPICTQPTCWKFTVTLPVKLTLKLVQVVLVTKGATTCDKKGYSI